MMEYVYTAEDYFIDDEAEEVEDAMEDLIKDDYNDIDSIADIDDDEEEDDDLEDYDEEDFENDDFEDLDTDIEDEEEYVDYYLKEE